MAAHVLANLAVKNLHRRLWTRDDVRAWLSDMDTDLRLAVSSKINEILERQ